MRVNRTLVRYRVEAIDSGGRSVMTPYADDPQPNFAYFVYDGPAPWRGAIHAKSLGGLNKVQTYNFGQMRPLPVYNLAGAADGCRGFAVHSQQHAAWRLYGV